MAESRTALVVGCGSIGTRHARNLTSLGVDVSVFDADEERVRSLANDVGVRVHRSFDDGLSENPDITVIATPTDYHIAQARTAADAGCDLFVEKPLSNTIKGIDALLETVTAHDLVTMIGCNLRFHPAVRTVRDLLGEDRIGEVISARINGGSFLPEWHPDEDYREMYSAKAGVGGVLLDYVHELNYARWFFGEPTAVSGMLGSTSPLEIETEDTAIILVRFESGTLCNVHLSYTQQPYERSCRIVGESGTIRWDWADHSVRRYDPEAEEWQTEGQYSEWETNTMYVEMMEHFLDCVRSRTNPTSTLADGWRDLQLALAAKESHDCMKHVEI